MTIFSKVVGLVAAFGAWVEIIFAHILVFSACAIEVQHINEILLLFTSNVMKKKYV